MNIHRKTLLQGLAAALLATAVPAWAQGGAYPSKPISFIVPFTAGSGTDVIARRITPLLEKALGQPIVVENRPGAGGTLGASQVLAAAADGHTVLIHSAGHVANAALYPKLSYDTLKDFTPIAMLATLPNVLVVSPGSGIKSVADLLARAKAQPGKMSYASAGNGSATHINAEKFRIAAQVNALHVPYRGTPPAITDVIGGQVDWFFSPLVSALPLIQDKRLVALAVGTPQRSPSLPDVPTTVEAGLPDSAYTFWVGMFVSAKTPADVAARLSRETAKVLQMPEVKAAFEKLGADASSLSQPAFAELVRQEYQSTGALIRQAGIKPD
ncbi:Bug family tripartite tricarboxylate transporter substrate binding protein [Variovorax terrae]|uniref:Tripartite tricarboxylate transporter substrate binding protein n=1 Tax=Variovorax terrae TaxID=2923278 RepID=A0A9X1VUT4_9BURK|nr:tripartite tricarboxylate transporter substrate binding protein [Variovorax terrae]MCJ0763629.1 tripartite tricarboxylate transporter substrate binding protein [Variovorax terrae]